MKNLNRNNIVNIDKFFEFNEYGENKRSKLAGRSEIIDMDSVDEVLKKYASWYDINCKNPIYRGVRTMNVNREDDFLMIDPSKHERVSIDNANYYTLVMDNDKRWGEYPNRSQSVIASTLRDSTRRYGTVYRVIPIFENSKIAIVPDIDILVAFSKAFHHNEMYITCDKCNGDGEVSLGGSDVDDYKMCHKCSEEGSVRVSNLSEFITKLKTDFNLTEDNYTWNEFVSKIGDRLPQISKILDPKLNGFKLINYNNHSNIGMMNEVWTDSKCLLIREDLLK